MKQFAANPKGVTDILQEKHAFIAGCGGLGSNVATLLVRAGIGELTIVDFDTIELSNLNRQAYTTKQVGLLKVETLKNNLLAIQPKLNITAINKRIELSNIASIIPKKNDIIFECFDSAESKALLVQHALQYHRDVPIIAVSGISGAGDLNSITCTKKFNNLFLIGDQTTESTELGVLSTRVMFAASMQAHTGIEQLLNARD